MAKFHYPQERERVRKVSFEHAEYLMAQKVRIGAPKEGKRDKVSVLSGDERGKTARKIG